MNYAETLDYLYLRLPMFTRIGAAALKNNLNNTTALCKLLDNPEQKFKSIHIAGTNGKGSTSHMLAAILQTAGYKTGLYTSPHLLDFRERIRINGKMIPESNVVKFVENQQQAIEKIEPSFFEVTVAMAFEHFAINQVDIAVIETGLGGRLDSTNVISPLLSVITNIGYDHMNILGNTLQEIASEKAGIIKRNVPVIIGEKQEELAEFFIRKSQESGSTIRFASEEWEVRQSESPKVWKLENTSHISYFISHISTKEVPRTHPAKKFPSISLDLKGTYQTKNLATVLSATAELRAQGWQISDAQIQTALGQVGKLTGLMGRWQTLSTNPLVICDTGHNKDGIIEVLKNIESTPHSKLHMVIGMVKDKEISKILALLPKEAIYYFCSPELERAKPALELQNEALLIGLKGKVYTTVKSALEAAKSASLTNDLVFVGGSTFVVAEAL